MAKKKFDIVDEYDQVPEEDADLITQAEQKAANPEEITLESVPVPSDQLKEMKGLVVEQKYDQVGRIFASLIS